jgi:hypothetical protein
MGRSLGGKTHFSRRKRHPKPPERRPPGFLFLPRNERFQSVAVDFPSRSNLAQGARRPGTRASFARANCFSDLTPPLRNFSGHERSCPWTTFRGDLKKADRALSALTRCRHYTRPFSKGKVFSLFSALWNNRQLHIGLAVAGRSAPSIFRFFVMAAPGL